MYLYCAGNISTPGTQASFAQSGKRRLLSSYGSESCSQGLLKFVSGGYPLMVTVDPAGKGDYSVVQIDDETGKQFIAWLRQNRLAPTVETFEKFLEAL